MQLADAINGCYEALGGLLIFNHCRVLLREKAVAGVSAISIALFLTWAFWNLFYYPYLGQWISFFGGVVILLANLTWLILILVYRKNRAS